MQSKFLICNSIICFILYCLFSWRQTRWIRWINWFNWCRSAIMQMDCYFTRKWYPGPISLKSLVLCPALKFYCRPQCNYKFAWDELTTFDSFSSGIRTIFITNETKQLKAWSLVYVFIYFVSFRFTFMYFSIGSWMIIFVHFYLVISLIYSDSKTKKKNQQSLLYYFWSSTSRTESINIRSNVKIYKSISKFARKYY